MRPRPIACLLALATTVALACHAHHHTAAPAGNHARRAGPPPHAPAHGYRHKQATRVGEVELVFDAGIGIYVVLGRPGYFFDRGHFYRKLNGVWHVSAHIDAGWAVVSGGGLPRGLVKKAAKHKDKHERKHKDKHKKQHPAKHGY
jgi:hypothetical protein